MARKATAQDVADLAGVSRSAVSLVLNGRAAGNISVENQRAVMAAAEQLHYTPNAVAISLRSRRTHTIGVLSWRGRASFAQVLLHRALQKAHEYRYLLLMMDTAGDRELELKQLAILRDRQVDGFLIIAPDLVEYEPVEQLVSTPTVLINCVDPLGVVSSVAPDERDAGRRAAAVLLERGHRRIGVLGGDPEAFQSQLRLQGVQRRLEAAGLPLRATVSSTGSIDEGYRAALALLDTPQRPTALICLQERLAVGAALAATELGLPVPERLSLVSLEDGEQLAETMVPPFTTVHRPDQGMAEEGVSLLVEQLSSSDRPEVRQLLFSCPVRPRFSVAAPAQA